MVQGFYTLDEAANTLGMSPDELNRMAQRREIRAFADRGTWRFRTQDVDEMARQRGLGSDPDLQVSDAPSSSASKPKSGVKGPASSMDEDLIPQDDDIFGADFDSSSGSLSLEEDSVALGGESGPGSSGRPPSSHKSGGSDVRLVLEKGSFDFELTTDSSGRLLEESAKRKTSGKPASSGKLVPENDSDVRVDFDNSHTLDDSMVSSGGPKPDSDVRLDAGDIPPRSGIDERMASMQTEEIDLDAELQQADEASLKRKSTSKPAPPSGLSSPPKTKPQPPGKTKATPPARPTGLPTSSPFELSESDLDVPMSGSQSGSGERVPLGSEFELTLAPEDSASPLSLGDDEDVDLGGLPPRSDLGSSARAELSGINLHDPADSGISLEGASSESVDFELTLDDDASSGPKTIKGKIGDSDSEFELTLDDSSPSLGSSTSGVSSGASGPSSDQKDIFETDFDLPALEEESASQAVALEEGDTDLESSDFDLAIEDSGVNLSKSESGSQVVTLDEEEPGRGPRSGRMAASSDSEIGSVDEMLLEDELRGVEEETEEEEELAPAGSIPAAQAEWGLLPVFAMGVCVMLMFVAGLMAFELLHGMWGYHQSSKPSGLLVRGISDMFTSEGLPKE
jgi:excisionase family DNA binding protein